MNDEIKMIPIDRIRVLNPRYRDRKKFEAIIQSIKNLGLKKPIQVSLRSAQEAEEPGYDLVCGQGRIEACMALGYKEIPALVVEISKEDRLLRSLVENMARRFPKPLDLIREIERLKTQGYSNVEIGTKLDIADGLVGGLIALNKAGEERLLEVAINGKIPLGVAMDIAKADTVEVQRELLKAYESKQLNQVSIRTVKRLIEQRRFLGKDRSTNHPSKRARTTSADSLVNAYRRESQRQRQIIKKARICDARLVFIVTAFGKLLSDENFVTLLRAESLSTMPKYLYTKLGKKIQGGCMSELKLGFEMKKIRLPLGDILPVRQIGGQERIDRYQTIVRSIKEVGMVEPLMVHPQKGASGKYLLVDGHLRLHALRELGETEADCIIANDDESYTYNARISRMAPIQEHKMILKAVQQGKVKPERIAAALNVPLSHVQSSLTLLDGINPEAVDLLKDKLIAPKAIRCLKKVSGVRQIEIAELMVSVNNYTAGYAEALVFGTPKDQLADPAEPKKKDGLSPEEIGRMEQEMETLEHDLKAVEESYGENVLNLTCARGYIKRLLDNAKVVRFLNSNYSDVCSEFQAIAAAETL